MDITYLDPVTLLLKDVGEGPRFQALQESLTYRDKRLQFQIQRLQKNRWMDADIKANQIADLRKKEKVCLLKLGDQGWTSPSGLLPMLQEKFQGKLTSPLDPLWGKPFAWATEPPKLRPYQSQAYDALIKARHAGISLPTGSGKSLLACYLIRNLGLKTVIMAPSINIADQLYDDLSRYLGRKYVGKFYSGKKEPQKKVVVAVAASLTRLNPEDPAYEQLQETKVFIADEAHRCPAATLEKVCFGLMAPAEWRFFLSATQLREDGLELLLKAITGPIVYEMTLREGVDQGYLARPMFKMIGVKSRVDFQSADALEMNRRHLMHNPDVLAIAASIANQAVEQLGHQVLILIDEVQQFNGLIGLLKHETEFAHGPVKKGDVPERYQESNPTFLVNAFNQKKFPILVGTSCISEGTDVRPVKTMIYVKGGKSEIDVRQSLGRCTRRVEGKTACNVVDFYVMNVDILKRHAKVRKQIYEDTYGPVDMIEWPEY
jgi:superfamily II DNA or RNA helicase